jgi:hypothetical protein
MKYLIIFLALVGCSTTVPVTSRFPESPKYANEPCSPLQKLNDDAKLSDVATTVTENYSLYYDCSAKNDAWIEWYRVQKQIFESIK